MPSYDNDNHERKSILQVIREKGPLHFESDSFLRFMDKMPGGFLVYCANQDEEIIYANQALLRMFRCDTLEQFREHTGNSFRGIVHPDDLEKVEQSIREQIAASQYDLDYVEHRMIRRDGTTGWLDNYGHFVYSEVAGDIFYVFLGDATEKRERSAQEKDDLMKAQQDLLADALTKANLAIASKNEFLSNMSHDMRTPLHAMFGLTSLAKLNAADPELTLDYLERVEAAGRQLLDMIDKVLEVSSLSGSSGVKAVECSLKDILQEVYDFLQPQAEEKNITFTMDSSGLRRPAVYADREKLHQLVLYLANNAVTYTDPGGCVSIVAQEVQKLSHDYAVYRVVVSDNGIGISPEFLEKIFEPFTRVKNSTLSGIHGIGLGLTIAKSIVDMMGGTIQIKSAVGKGTVFTTTFHFRLQPRPTAFRKSLPIKETAQRILLAEDNEINREIEIELLEQLGFIIDPAEDGQIALDKVKASPPGHYDLVLMDLQMPVMDGWQASEAIRALPDPILSQIPIIALSANVLPSDQKRSKECGIDAHLNKPMDLPLLLATIEEITGLPRPS